jgi:hypothetical protein
MTAQQDDLTPGQRRLLEHMQEAEKEGVSMRDYYLSHGLNVKGMYRARSKLVDRGLLPPLRPQQSSSTRPSSPKAFAAVQVVPTAAINGRGGCRFRSPGGWVIECDGLPEISWVQQLMGVQS